MSRVGSYFFIFSLSSPCILFIGRAGASTTRRLITLLSVGWLPPYVHPSGACLILGTRIPFGLFTLSRVTPHRGCVSSDGCENLVALWLHQQPSLCLRCHSNLLSNGPHKGTQFPGNGYHHLVRVFASGDQASIAFAQSDLRLPADVLDGFRLLFEPQLYMPTDFGGIPVGPGPFDQGASRVVLPALVIDPCRRRSPLEYSEGISPRYFISCLGFSKRVRSPSSATMVTATVNCTPRRA